LSETVSLIESIEGLSSSVVRSSNVLVTICKSLERNNQLDVGRLVHELSRSEERTDLIFETVAERIMSLEFLNINSDYLLDIAKYIDEISDLIERAGLLFQYLGRFSDQDLIVLLIEAAAQVQKITTGVTECLKELANESGAVREKSDLLSEREKAMDALREEFNSKIVSSGDELTVDQKIWMKEIFGNLDQVADVGRDLGILFRVVGVKLDKQRKLTLKQPPR
jgi:uncharacterized protein Yka (UPF0111/DUF47 family)